MFPVLPYNEELRQEYCQKTWGVEIRTEWPPIEFWGRNILTATNIIFSNGVSQLNINIRRKVKLILL